MTRKGPLNYFDKMFRPENFPTASGLRYCKPTLQYLSPEAVGKFSGLKILSKWLRGPFLVTERKSENYSVGQISLLSGVIGKAFIAECWSDFQACFQ